MRTKTVIVASIAALTLIWRLPVQALGTTPVAQPPTLFRSVTVLTMNADDEVLTDRDVVVRGGKIWSISPTGDDPPSGAMIVDGRGKFLVPGLTDMHVHLQSEPELFLYLAYGVTTVFDLSGSPKTLEMRRAVAAGETLGPQIFSTGPTLGGESPLNPKHLRLRDSDEARAAIDTIHREGYDGVKVYSDILPEAFSAAVRRAHEVGLPVFGHVPWALRAEKTLGEKTLAAVAHAEELFAGFYSPTSRYMSGDHTWTPGPEDLARTPELVELLRTSGSSLIVNGNFIDRILAQAVDLKSVLAEPQVAYLPALRQLEWSDSRYANPDNPERSLQRNRAMSSFVPLFVERLAEAGIPLLIGSDASAPGAVPGYSAVSEIGYLERRCGLPPLVALSAATHEARDFFARHLPWAQPFGQVRAGFRADLLLLRSDPREGVEKALLSRAGVMVAGAWHSAQELDAELVQRGRTNTAVREPLQQVLEGFESEDSESSAAAVARLLADIPSARGDVEGLLIEAGGYLNRRRAGSDFAEAWARMAVGQLSDSVELRMILVDALIDRTKLDEARNTLLEILASTPNHPGATQKLQWIEELKAAN